MQTNNAHDPYDGNLLIEYLGSIPTITHGAKILTYLPDVPDNVTDIPYEKRVHYLLRLKDLHIPSKEGLKLLDTIDLMIRKSYSYRSPSEPKTWGLISGNPVTSFCGPSSPAIAASVVGHAGVGKTQAIQRALSYYPQIIRHKEFPRIIGEHQQVVWISAEVPANGKLDQLAVNLMVAWDEAFKNAMPEHQDRFNETLASSKRDGMRMFEEWRQVALSHSLGILHLDEIQNFFRLPTLLDRRRQKDNQDLDLSIVEDKCLKAILTFINTYRMAVLCSGTPDGMKALSKRFSTLQRLTSFGYHQIHRFESVDDPEFKHTFLPQLVKYQLVEKKLPISTELAKLLLELTGGIKRLLIVIWIDAHRVAFNRGKDDLLLDDFRVAARTYLKPVSEAIHAINSGRPDLMSRYDDMISLVEGSFENSTSPYN